MHGDDELVEQLLQRLARRLGGRRQAKAHLLAVGARSYAAIADLITPEWGSAESSSNEPEGLSFVPHDSAESRASQEESYPALRVLRATFMPYAIDIFGPRIARPTTVRLQARRRDVYFHVDQHSDGLWLRADGEPITALVSFATRRLKGQASFTLGGLAPSEIQPALVLLVLIDEPRVWACTYAYALRALEKLAAGDRVKWFSRAASPRALRVVLPKKQTALDLANTLHTDQKTGPFGSEAPAGT